MTNLVRSLAKVRVEQNAGVVLLVRTRVDPADMSKRPVLGTRDIPGEAESGRGLAAATGDQQLDADRVELRAVQVRAAVQREELVAEQLEITASESTEACSLKQLLTYSPGAMEAGIVTTDLRKQIFKYHIFPPRLHTYV